MAGVREHSLSGRTAKDLVPLNVGVSNTRVEQLANKLITYAQVIDYTKHNREVDIESKMSALNLRIYRRTTRGAMEYFVAPTVGSNAERTYKIGIREHEVNKNRASQINGAIHDIADTDVSEFTGMSVYQAAAEMLTPMESRAGRATVPTRIKLLFSQGGGSCCGKLYQGVLQVPSSLMALTIAL